MRGGVIFFDKLTKKSHSEKMGRGGGGGGAGGGLGDRASELT